MSNAINEQKAIISIDEYDIPLDKAYQLGYYDSIVDLIRTLRAGRSGQNNR